MLLIENDVRGTRCGACTHAERDDIPGVRYIGIKFTKSYSCASGHYPFPVEKDAYCQAYVKKVKPPVLT